jgi:glycosyltransferase involved in cell wall biosynthesis
MTRLLQAMAGADHGGAEAFFERLALALQRAGLDQHVLIRRNARRAAMLRDGGVAVTELPFGGVLDVVTHWGFRRAVARFRPTIALTWMNRATRFCPRGRFVHVGRLGGYYDLKYYRDCGHLIGNTPDIRNWLVGQGWPPANAHYVPNFVSDIRAAAASRKAFSTPPQAPLIFALGRLHANKAFDVLLKALTDVPGAYLWIAGDGPLLGELERLASRLGVMPRVRFLGWREDIAALRAAVQQFAAFALNRHQTRQVVFAGIAQRRIDRVVDVDLPGVDDRHVEPGADRVVEEHRMHRPAHRFVAAEAERQV